MTPLSNPNQIIQSVKGHPKLIFADDFEIVVQHEARQNRKFLEGQASAREGFEGFWVQLRLLHRKRLGMASTDDTSVDGLRALVEQAFHLAEQSGVDPWFRLPAWKYRETAAVSADNRQYDSLAAHLTQVPPGLRESYTTNTVRTTLARKHEKTELKTIQTAHFADLSFRTRRSEAALYQRRWGHNRDVSDRGERIEALSRDAILYESLENRKAALEEATQVVLAPWVGADWLTSVGALFALERVPWSDKGWEKGLSSALSIQDEGLSGDAPFRAQWDLEGTPTQNTWLVERGEFRTYLHNATSGAQCNRPSTGNWRRLPPGGFPRVAPWKLTIPASELSSPWKDARKLAYLFSVMPPHWEGPRHGSWNRVVAGVLLQRGEPVAQIEPTEIHWSIFEMLRSVTGVDNSSQTFGNVACPSLWWDKMPKDTTGGEPQRFGRT